MKLLYIEYEKVDRIKFRRVYKMYDRRKIKRLLKETIFISNFKLAKNTINISVSTLKNLERIKT